MVAHDSVNRALLLQLLDQPLAAYWKIVQDPCSLNEIEIVGEGRNSGGSTVWLCVLMA